MSFSPIVWLASGIIIMACEIFVPGFIIFWFGAGGILTALFIFIGIIPENNAEWQWIFSLSPLCPAGILALNPEKKFQRNTVDVSRDATLVNLRRKSNIEDRARIRRGRALQLVPRNKKWQAESDETIESGEEITVIDAKGIKLIVKHT